MIPDAGDTAVNKHKYPCPRGAHCLLGKADLKRINVKINIITNHGEGVRR